MLNILKFRSSKPSCNGYAVVTGAGSGIGRSFALELAKRNTAVVCADLKLESAEETVALIEKAGGKAYAVACDVGKAGQVKQLAAKSEKLLGNPVTLLVNNAGVGIGGKFEELSLEMGYGREPVGCGARLSLLCARVQEAGAWRHHQCGFCRVIYGCAGDECL